MPTFEVKGPDGSVYEVNAPEGATEAQAIEYVKNNMGGMSAQKPAAVKLGEFLGGVPRQLGLTARYALEGPAQAAQFITEPVRQLVTDPLSRAVGAGERGKPLGQMASDFADLIGLPSPEGANERVVGDAARMGFGAALPMGVGYATANRAANAGMQTAGRAGQAVASTGAGKAIGQALTVNPMSQLSAAAGAGVGMGASREAGDSPSAQLVSGLLGTVVGGLAPGAVQSVAQRINSMRSSPLQLEGKITLALRESGVDYSQLPRNVRDSLLADVRKAMATGGEVNPDALRRLADFRLTGTTPTRGMVSLDPVQITREQNLAKIGANTADDGLTGLSRVQNQNNATLIRNLNNLGASQGNVDDAGRLVTSSVSGRQAQLRAAERAAWDAARGSPGYRQPISAGVLSDINRSLDDEALMPFMNPTISRYMEAFQSGQRPFTPQDYRNLQSMLSREIAKGGNEGAAARLAQRILERADVAPVTQTGPGVVTGQTAAAMRAEDAAAAASAGSIDAVNRARSATRSAYAYEDSSPLVRSVLSDGASADPQRIAQRFVIGGTANEARSLAQEVGPQGIPAIKNAILAHLKSKALNDASDEVGKFSQSAFNKELRKIGEDKLRVFFSTEEIAQLQANGRVASYMQTQPVGSAVNNSNSGALVAGKAYDFLSMLPLGRSVIVDPLRSIEISLGQRSAQNVTPGLLQAPVKRLPMQSLLGPSVAAGGLLAAPGPERP